MAAGSTHTQLQSHGDRVGCSQRQERWAKGKQSEVAHQDKSGLGD